MDPTQFGLRREERAYLAVADVTAPLGELLGTTTVRHDRDRASLGGWYATERASTPTGKRSKHQLLLESETYTAVWYRFSMVDLANAA